MRIQECVSTLILTIFLLLGVSDAFAQAKADLPPADRKGSKDSALLKRYESSIIVAYDQKGFTEFTLPLSRLEEVEGKRDAKNNRYHEPKNRKALEGAYTRLVYLVPAGRSPLEVSRNYRDEIKSKGGEILFECKDSDCGGDPERSISGGGASMSLAMYLYPEARIADAYASAGYCAVTEHIGDQRYLAAQIPSSGAHVSVLTYSLISPDRNAPCNALNDRTIAVVDIVEAKAREQRMVAVKATEMAATISGTGRIALYGIYFDFNKADVKSESDPTLEQIAKLLKDNSALRLLVVGHTDNVGGFPFNTDLSQRRAAAVVRSLASRYGIGKDRLAPHGVSFASRVDIEQDGGRSREEPPRRTGGELMANS